MAFKVGDRVKWVSSGTEKTGEILAIVPSGKVPADVGFPKAGGGGFARDHETYVIEGRKQNSRGPYGPKAKYWPLVSLLHAIP